MPIRLHPEDRLSDALKLHPRMTERIISLNPHDFARLRNPLMRRLMPPRISIARLSLMVGLPLGELLEYLHDWAEIPLSDTERAELRASTQEISTLPVNKRHAPEWVNQQPAAVVDLLASDEALDCDPMPPIQDAMSATAPGDVVLVKHKWDPQHLYDLWRLAGYEHFAMQKSHDEWWIFVRKC